MKKTHPLLWWISPHDLLVFCVWNDFRIQSWRVGLYLFKKPQLKKNTYFLRKIVLVDWSMFIPPWWVFITCQLPALLFLVGILVQNKPSLKKANMARAYTHPLRNHGFVPWIFPAPGLSLTVQKLSDWFSADPRHHDKEPKIFPGHDVVLPHRDGHYLGVPSWSNWRMNVKTYWFM